MFNRPSREDQLRIQALAMAIEVNQHQTADYIAHEAERFLLFLKGQTAPLVSSAATMKRPAA